jgi:hypothetical protein
VMTCKQEYIIISMSNYVLNTCTKESYVIELISNNLVNTPIHAFP